MPADRTGALAPGATIGILGGGQLGRMLAVAAAQLGLSTHVFCPDPDSPAFDVSAHYTVAPYDDLRALEAFAADVDVVTYEFENITVDAVELLAATCPVRPGPRALEVAQDRFNEKSFLTGAGVPVGPYAAIDDLDDLKAALQRLKTPAILKTRRFGYDGKGQVRIDDAKDAEAAYEAIACAPAVLEAFVPFSREVSVIAVRGVNGETAVYDVPENVHRNHILHTSTVPANIALATRQKAAEIAATIVDGLDYIGVIGVELFVVEEGGVERLVVNEIAPRVHNSGHWTRDACVCSQFENHIRAIAGWPLGSVSRHSDAVMTNLIGEEAEHWQALAGENNCCLTLYGKREIRPGRKMGHVTRLQPLTKAPC